MTVPGSGSKALSGVVFAITLVIGAFGAKAQEVPSTFAPIAQDLLPTVVNISTRQTVESPGRGPSPFEDLPEGHPFREFFERFPGIPGMPEGPGRRPQQRELQSLGSGFIVDSEGYIVTNHHVVAEADEITVVLHDETRLDAELVGSDPDTDLALLRVEHDSPLPEVAWGDSDAAEVGDWVLAIGNPFGLGGSVSAGIISAHERDIRAGPLSEFIQTDAAINRGNSGGPLLNMDGEVIGVNSAILSPTGGFIGIGFALPSSLAQPIIAQLQSEGRVTRAWLGVAIQPVTEELAEAFELPEASGALVGSVQPDSPAAEVGLRQGDVITEIDGESVSDSRELARRIGLSEPGREVTLTLWRDGEEMQQQVTLGQRDPGDVAGAPDEEPDAQPDESPTAQALGLQIAAATPDVLNEFDLPAGTEGVVVVNVARGSPASARGIQPGDVIAQVGRTSVSEPDEIHQAVTEALELGAQSIVLLVQREDSAQFIPVPLARAEE